LLSWGLHAQGNGTYTLYAFAYDVDGHHTTLGSKTIAVDNAHATKPFGALDTPSYGGTVTGPFWNYGWALTPNATPACTVVNGSVTTHIDSGPGFVVNYGDPRPDIAGSFSGFSNGSNSGGAYYIDTTRLSNGVHSIGWLVYDNCGRGDGIGSRFFTVLNGGTRPSESAGDVSSDSRAPAPAARPSRDPEAATAVPPPAARPAASSGIVSVRHLGGEWERVAPDTNGWHAIDVPQGGRIEVQLPPTASSEYTGHQVVSTERRPLPVGSSLDASAGVFYWQPAPAFLGVFDLVFEGPGTGAARVRVVVR
jgi:hypothetical protein